MPATGRTFWAGTRRRVRLWERKATPRRWTRDRRQVLRAEQATDIDQRNDLGRLQVRMTNDRQVMVDGRAWVVGLAGQSGGTAERYTALQYVGWWLSGSPYLCYRTGQPYRKHSNPEDPATPDYYRVFI